MSSAPYSVRSVIIYIFCFLSSWCCIQHNNIIFVVHNIILYTLIAQKQGVSFDRFQVGTNMINASIFINNFFSAWLQIIQDQTSQIIIPQNMFVQATLIYASVVFICILHMPKLRS